MSLIDQGTQIRVGPGQESEITIQSTGYPGLHFFVDVNHGEGRVRIIDIGSPKKDPFDEPITDEKARFYKTIYAPGKRMRLTVINSRKDNTSIRFDFKVSGFGFATVPRDEPEST